MELISVRELYKNTAKYADQTIEIGGCAYLKCEFQNVIIEDSGSFDYLLLRVQYGRLSSLADGAVGYDAECGGFKFPISHQP